MGQTISGLINRLPGGYVASERLDEIELRFGLETEQEGYDARTRGMRRWIEVNREFEPAGDVVPVPSVYRDAFEGAVDVIIRESFLDGNELVTHAIEWWLFQIWFLIEWAIIGRFEYRHMSASVLNQFEILIEMRDEERQSRPGAVLFEYTRILRNLFRMPDFGLSEPAIYVFAELLRCENIPEMSSSLQYSMNRMFQWQPIVDPQTPIERAITNLPLRPIEEVVQASEEAECGICREIVEAGTEVTVLEPFCSHWFHTGCIHYVLRFRRGNRLCPACRTRIILES